MNRVKRAVMVAAVLLVAASGIAAQSGLAAARALQDASRDVARTALPVVVRIDTVDVVRTDAPASPFNFFFGTPDRGGSDRSFRREGLGSGVIVRQTRDTVYVITNNHVVETADEVSVTMHDGTAIEAEIVGRDPRRDLALVSFQYREQVPVADLGDSASVQVGDLAFAVGSPFGFSNTITMGIISATGRQSPGGTVTLTDFIQTDAAINRGNSGGALVNLEGEVIGINTWIASSSGGNNGLGFAIPINVVRPVVDQLIDRGTVAYGWLGITVGNMAFDMSSHERLEEPQGAFVSSVFRGGPADRGGLVPGDIVTRINGDEIASQQDLITTVANLEPGSRATFVVQRDGRQMAVRVTMGDTESSDPDVTRLFPGLSVVPITGDVRDNLGFRSTGELIVADVERNSPADTAGIRPRDIILEVDGERVRTLDEFYRALNESSGRDAMFRLDRNGTEVLIGINLR